MKEEANWCSWEKFFELTGGPHDIKEASEQRAKKRKKKKPVNHRPRTCADCGTKFHGVGLTSIFLDGEFCHPDCISNSRKLCQ